MKTILPLIAKNQLQLSLVTVKISNIFPKTLYFIYRTIIIFVQSAKVLDSTSISREKHIYVRLMKCRFDYK